MPKGYKKDGTKLGFKKGHKVNLGKKNHLGFRNSKETIEKMREKSIFQKNFIPWNKDIPCSKETRKKISDTLKRKGIEPKEKFVGHGKNHPMYKNGKPKCIDCGERLSSYNKGQKRCSKCFHI